MPTTEIKFRLSSIVVSAVFISLCVPTAAENRRCYWCGPLADQVHRSQRAPPCSGPTPQVTDCDPGFPYCAIVATAPHYIESRYCVKLYQDECYSLYCNSTRTWRMTCPCRGDLCNGPNTERELDAFAGLAKLVARTQHTKNRRALMNTSGFISMNTNRKTRIDNTSVEESKNNNNNLTDNNEANEDDVKVNEDDVQENEDNVKDNEDNVKANEDDVKTNEDDIKPNEDQTNDTTTAVDTDAKDMESHIDTTTANVPPDLKSDVGQMIETTTQANVEVQNNEATTNIPVTDEVIKTSNSHINETSIEIDIPSASIESSDLKTEIILMSSEKTIIINESKLPDITSTKVNIPDVPTTPEIITQAAIVPKAMPETTTVATKPTPTEVKMNENKVKTDEQLPTIIALQHDTTEAKATPTLRATTTSKTENNTAVRIDTHILTLAISVVINYV